MLVNQSVLSREKRERERERWGRGRERQIDLWNWFMQLRLASVKFIW